jgi:hypothetical protein
MMLMWMRDMMPTRQRAQARVDVFWGADASRVTEKADDHGEYASAG